MQSLAVIEHFDIFGHGHARPPPGRKDLLVVHFVFQAGEKRLGHGATPAHPSASHRLDNASLGAVGGKSLRNILGAMVTI